jgi:hypothetical protein
VNRLGFFVILALAFAIVAFGLLRSTAGDALRIGRGTPSQADRQQMLVSGQCAIRGDGVVLGKVTQVFTPTRAFPMTRYEIQGLSEKRVMRVEEGDVRLVPCRSLRQ